MPLRRASNALHGFEDFRQLRREGRNNRPAFRARTKLDELGYRHQGQPSPSLLQQRVEFLFLGVLLGEVLVGGLIANYIEQASGFGRIQESAAVGELAYRYRGVRP